MMQIIIFELFLYLTPFDPDEVDKYSCSINLVHNSVMVFLLIKGCKRFLLWSLIFQEILIICRHLHSFRCTEGKRRFHLASLFVTDLWFC